MSRDTVLALGDWSTGGIEEVHDGGLLPSTLAWEIAKVQFPDLDLSQLQPR